MQKLIMFYHQNQRNGGCITMPEILVRNSTYDTEFTVISKNDYRASLALLKYLAGRGIQPCVFIEQHEGSRETFYDSFTVVGDPAPFSKWFEEEPKNRPLYKDAPEFRYLDAPNDKALSEWAGSVSFLGSEMWTYNESFHLIQAFKFTSHYPAEISTDPANNEFTECGFVTAKEIKRAYYH